MPTLEWLRGRFKEGYDSGDILSLIPNRRRYREERKIGGSYRKVFREALLPYLRPGARVLELGPGRGSWSRAILKALPEGELHAVDFQDVRQWIDPHGVETRLTCYRVSDNSFAGVPDGYFDFFWSFGVLCHNNLDAIEEVLGNARRKMKPGAYAIHQYADWDKLDAFGWRRGKVPEEFKTKPDDQIWWPRNTQRSMTNAATSAGWTVVAVDMGLLARDSMILLQNATDGGH